MLASRETSASPVVTPTRSSSRLLDGEGADRERGAHGALRVVLVCCRRAEEGHHRIADELLDRAAAALELGRGAVVIRAGTARTSSGSSCSAFAVKPTRSQKRTVTTLRSSRVGAAMAVRDAPHIPHRRKPSGFSWPQLGQVITGGEYGVRGSSLNSWRGSRTPRCTTSLRRPTWWRSSPGGRSSGARPVHVYWPQASLPSRDVAIQRDG